MEPLGVGIIGYGQMGKVYAHAHQSLPFYYSPLPRRTRLVGVCVRREETAQPAREHGGFEFATTDPEALLARDDIQLIHVATPNDTHADLTCRALAAGKAVYCDKPLCRDEGEAMRIVAAARDAAVTHQTGFHCRFIPATLRAKRLVESGALGRIYQFRGEYLHSGYIDPDRPMSWRLDRERSGGGALYDLGAHIIDLMRWLVGEFTRVSARLVTQIGDRPRAKGSAERVPVEVDDIALLTAETAGGAIGTLEATRLATGANDQIRFEIHGERGALIYNGDTPGPMYLGHYDNTAADAPYGGDRGFRWIECVQRYEAPAVWPGPKFACGYLRFQAHSVFEFVRRVAEGLPGDPDLVEGARTQFVLTAAQRSAASGAPEAVGTLGPP
jgi:predicted dehydrogenase